MTKQYCLYGEPIGSSAIYPQTQNYGRTSWLLYTCRYKTNFFTYGRSVSYQLIAIGAGFDPSALHVCLWWTKWFWDIFYSKNFDL